MKIIHILASNGFSGAENVVCQIIDMFRDDNDIQMIYCSPDGEIRETLAERDIGYFPLKTLSVSELRRMIKEEQPNIIHAHDFRASMLAAVSAGCIPVISHLHNNSPWLKTRGMRSMLYALTCRHYSAIFTVSNSVFNEYVYGDKYKDKLTVIGNPVSTEVILQKTDQGKDTRKKYDVGFCGRQTPQKNPGAFVEIVGKLKADVPNLSAVMIGDGELKDETQALIREKGLENDISMVGFKKNPYPIIQSCKVLCMPSRWEGFGLAAMEALTLGVPVVCSNVGGLPDIVTDECGRVCRDEEEMATECFRLLTSKERLEQKSKMAAERARELNNITNYKEKLKGIYNELRRV